MKRLALAATALGGILLLTSSLPPSAFCTTTQTPLEPIMLKGKNKAVGVYRVDGLVDNE